jgi:hypothetical protein
VEMKDGMTKEKEGFQKDGKAKKKPQEEVDR